MAYRDSSSSSSGLTIKNYQYFDHFIGDRANFWRSLSGGGAGFDRNVGVDSAHPGTTDLVLGSGSFANIYLGCQVDNNSMAFGGGNLSAEFYLKIVTLSSGSNRYNFYIGFSDVDNVAPTNGAYFEYIDNVNSGRFQCKTTASSTTTNNNSGITADTNWHYFKIVVNAAATSIEFYIDNVLVATNTTNIPTANVYPCIYLLNNGTASDTASVRFDAFLLTQSLS